MMTEKLGIWKFLSLCCTWWFVY